MGALTAEQLPSEQVFTELVKVFDYLRFMLGP